MLQHGELITQRTTLSSSVVKNVQENEVKMLLIDLSLDARPVDAGIVIYKSGSGSISALRAP